MPRQIDIAIKNLQYVSMTDFCNRIDKIKNIDDKLAFATEYLLNHRPNIDYALDEAIGVVRMKLADAIVEYKEMQAKETRNQQVEKAFPDEKVKHIDLNEYGNVENNKKLECFMAFPDTYLKHVGTKKIEELENQDMLIGLETMRQQRYEDVVDTINNYDLYLDLEENDRNYLHIGARLEAKFGGIASLEEASNATKPSFFAKLFRTTSTEGNNLLTAYKGFTTKDSPLFGRKDTLERAANSYLRHIYPNWEPGFPLIDKFQIDRLSGTQKSRVILCNAILEAVRKEDKMLEEYNKAIDPNDKNVEFDELFKEEVKKTNIVDLYKDLDEDLENENDMNVSDDYVLDREVTL